MKPVVEKADSSSSGVTRRQALRTGALGAAVVLTQITDAPSAEASTAAQDYIQYAWFWCHRCYCLFWGSASGFDGVCQGYPGAYTGPHAEGSRDYALYYGDDPITGYQSGWRWCHKCSQLHYGSSWCPAGGNHTTGSTDYLVQYKYGHLVQQGQGGWRYCVNCKCLWYGAGSSRGACTVGDFGHVAGSREYWVGYEGNI